MIPLINSTTKVLHSCGTIGVDVVGGEVVLCGSEAGSNAKKWFRAEAEVDGE